MVRKTERKGLRKDVGFGGESQHRKKRSWQISRVETGKQPIARVTRLLASNL